jgi:hypothetical protein
MGADRVVAVLELPRSTVPNWGAARAQLAAMTDAECMDAWCDAEQADPGSAPASPRSRLEEALTSCEQAWHGNERSMAVVLGAATNMLVAVGETWGDPVEGCADVELFAASGCAEAAGFLVGARLSEFRQAIDKIGA